MDSYILRAVCLGLLVLRIVVAEEPAMLGCSDESCMTCSPLTHVCSNCIPGKWGPTCDKSCPLTTCKNNVCDVLSAGKCTYGCMDGSYDNQGNCSDCPVNCKRCLDTNDCLECNYGWYGKKCDKKCSLRCAKCTQKYSGIDDVSDCLQCTSGNYGSFLSGCLYDCSLCRRGACSMTNCTYGCIPGYYNYKSLACVRCNSQCESCDSRSWDTARCLTCPPGKWGDLCSETCSEACEQNICDQSTGLCACSTGQWLDSDMKCRACHATCESCTNNSACTLCVDGYHGPRCELQCSSNCQRCADKHCSACLSGYFLRDSKCQKCPEGCLECNWIDYKRSVACTKCEAGYYIDIIVDKGIAKCYMCPTGCSECDWRGECQICAKGFRPFQQRCCPNTCKECVSPDYCTVCVDGYFGITCKSTCDNTDLCEHYRGTDKKQKHGNQLIASSGTRAVMATNLSTFGLITVVLVSCNL